MDNMRFNNPIIPTEKKTESQADLVTPKVRVWSKFRKSYILIGLVLLVIIVLAGIAAKFYLKAQQLQSEVQGSGVSEIQKIVAEVSKLIVLPKDEEPTVATVSDVEKLRDQAFFANAKNGDKVLIYVKAEKAILYDPVNKIIVEVAPLNSKASESTKIKSP
jgi:hypothetical protein